MLFLSLPIEVLHEVFRNLKGPDYGMLFDIREFRCLVRCCRHLNNLVTPHLYRCVMLTPSTIFLLLRSLLEKPTLGLLIKEARLVQELTSFGPVFKLDRAYTILRQPGLLPEGCTEYLQSNNRYNITLLLVELLLLRIRHVENLTMNVSLLSVTDQLFDRRRWSQSTESFAPQIFSNLNELLMFTEDGPSSDRDVIRQMQHLLTHSKLSCLKIQLTHPFRYENCQLRLLNVKSLTLCPGGMPQGAFESLLQICPNVQSLDYYSHFGPCNDYAMKDHDIKLRDVCMILQSHQMPLESLRLSFNGDIVGSEGDAGTLPDLRQFSRLRHLCLEAEALEYVREYKYSSSLSGLEDDWSDDYPECEEDNPEKWRGLPDVLFLSLLPSSLESLEVSNADCRFFKEISSLVNRKAQDFPNMRTVRLVSLDEAIDDRLLNMQADLRVVGIDLSWSVHQPEFEDSSL